MGVRQHCIRIHFYSHRHTHQNTNIHNITYACTQQIARTHNYIYMYTHAVKESVHGSGQYTQVHEHRHTHSHMPTSRQVNTPMHPHTHVPLVTSELTISSSWSLPLQCCPSALARPPHCLTTYRYSNHTQQHFIH